jgi:hypothetical protein
MALIRASKFGWPRVSARRDAMLLRCLPESGQTVSGSSPQETPGAVLEATQRCERRPAPQIAKEKTR